MNKLIISAPFGNYLSFPNTTSIIGTFTRHYRAGLFKRIWRVLSTVRHNRRQQSWLNKMGLPNPGLDSLGNFRSVIENEQIVSIHGFCKDDWDWLVGRLLLTNVREVEFNLSCPNVGHKPSIADVVPAMEYALSEDRIVIAKLPPVRWMDFAIPLYSLGVHYFHLCNTIPTPGGGMSGKPLKQYSLWAVEEVKQKWGNDVTVIGGGGITGVDDVRDFVAAGADHCAVGSLLFNPFKWCRIADMVAALQKG